MEKVQIVWNGTGGELDRSEIIVDDGDRSVRDAFIAFIGNNVIAAGDSFEVQSID